MAKQYYGSLNPFLAEEEPFRSNDRGTYGQEGFEAHESRLEQLQAQKRDLERRQIESTHRSLMVIAETQDVGNATAQELLAQGEKLDSAEKKLDTIEYMTKITQRHITGIKSVFGSLKNWVRGEKAYTQEGADGVNTGRQPSKLAAVVAANGASVTPSTATAAHPAMRLYQEDDVEDAAATTLQTRQQQSATGVARRPQVQVYGAGTAELDDNLELMAGGMKQLKDLAIGLGDEIEKQNEVIDRLKVKTDRVDEKLSGQTKQIRKML